MKPKTLNLKPIKGQSLIEILIALAVGIILIGAVTSAITLILRKSLDIRTTQVASLFAGEYADTLKSLAESDWNKIYIPPGAKGVSSQFYLKPSGSSSVLVSGTTTTPREGQNFVRYFSIENVNRDSCGVGNITTSAAASCAMQAGSSYIAEDPSTQKITIIVNWEGNRSINEVFYLSRSQNRIFDQGDWSGGPGQESFPTSTGISLINDKFLGSNNIDYTSARGSISEVNKSISADLTASVFDTGYASGTAINTIMWQGDRPAGTNVRFQIASSNASSGPWAYIGPDGSGATSYNPVDGNIPIQINLAQHNNKRYFRYKIFLDPNAGAGPTVDDVIINWSP